MYVWSICEDSSDFRGSQSSGISNKSGHFWINVLLLKNSTKEPSQLTQFSLAVEIWISRVQVYKVQVSNETKPPIGWFTQEIKNCLLSGFLLSSPCCKGIQGIKQAGIKVLNWDTPPKINIASAKWWYWKTIFLKWSLFRVFFFFRWLKCFRDSSRLPQLLS